MAAADPIAGVTRRMVETDTIRLQIAEQGAGPLVLLCHGFPESWYSWRHQFAPLAAAGYHVVAPDQRGYGGSDRPSDPTTYTQLHLVGDMVALLDALGEQQAVIVGHDWGAPVAWNAATLRPDRFRAVVGLSVPPLPRGSHRPTDGLRALAGNNRHYMVYFQTPGVAEAELERDPRLTLRRLLYAASGDVQVEQAWRPITPPDVTPLAGMTDTTTLPPWLTDADLDFYTEEFSRTGFTGGLNWYRNIDRSWELMRAWQDVRIKQPALYIAGDRDAVYQSMQALMPHLPHLVPGLRGTVILPGAGHWTQQERPAEVNAALIEFLQGL